MFHGLHHKGGVGTGSRAGMQTGKQGQLSPLVPTVPPCTVAGAGGAAWQQLMHTHSQARQTDQPAAGSTQLPAAASLTHTARLPPACRPAAASTASSQPALNRAATQGKCCAPANIVAPTCLPSSKGFHCQQPAMPYAVAADSSASQKSSLQGGRRAETVAACMCGLEAGRQMIQVQPDSGPAAGIHPSAACLQLTIKATGHAPEAHLRCVAGTSGSPSVDSSPDSAAAASAAAPGAWSVLSPPYSGLLQGGEGSNAGPWDEWCSRAAGQGWRASDCVTADCLRAPALPPPLSHLCSSGRRTPITPQEIHLKHTCAAGRPPRSPRATAASADGCSAPAAHAAPRGLQAGRRKGHSVGKPVGSGQYCGRSRRPSHTRSSSGAAGSEKGQIQM